MTCYLRFRAQRYEERAKTGQGREVSVLPAWTSLVKTVNGPKDIVVAIGLPEQQNWAGDQACANVVGRRAASLPTSYRVRVNMFGVEARVDSGKALAAAILGIFLFLAGCAGRGGPVPYEPKNFGRPDAETLAPSVDEGTLRIGALDKVKVNVFQVPELSGEFQVDSSGVIDFPLIGNVRALGRSEAELRQELVRRLGEKYLKNPNVQVALSERTMQSVTVDGSVRDPGVFQLKGTTTLMKAVAMAKGASEDANIRRVVIFRTINGQRMAGAFDLAAIRRAEAEDPPVYGNDIVVVDGSRTQQVFRNIISAIPVLGVLRPY